MRIAAFYSFKGGVGRTTALLNVAYCLAQRGRKVVVADWDLHAPGLSLMDFMRPEHGEPPRLGVLDYLLDLRDKKAAQRVSIAQILDSTRLAAEAQSREETEEQPRMQGELFFIPSGNLAEGVEKFVDAIKAAGLHDLKDFLKAIDPEDARLVFKVFCEELRRTPVPWKLAGSSGAPDYLLVDCRTGLTEIGDLLLGEATDFNVIVYGQDPQNLEGLRIALNARPRLPWEMAGNTMLLWSMEPQGQEALKLAQRKLKRALVAEICQKDSLGVTEAFPQEYKIPYHPEIPLSNLPIVHTYWHSDLARLYRHITGRFEEKCYWEDTLVAEQDKGLQGATAPQSVKPDIGALLDSKSAQRQTQLQQAQTELALAREVAPFLFAPPPWSFFERPVTDLIKESPEGVNPPQLELLCNLLTYSMSLTSGEKNRTLKAMPRLTTAQVERLIEILVEERTKFLTLSGVHYWQLLTGMFAAALDWWILTVPEAKKNLLEEEIFLPLLQGKQIEKLEISAHPLFRLLLAEACATAVEKEDSALKQWLKAKEMDALVLQIALKQKFCGQMDGFQTSDGIAGYAWARLGISLTEYGQAVREEEKTEWFEQAIAAYNKSLELRPEDAATLNNLGSVLNNRSRAAPEEEKAGWFEQAIAAYNKSLELRPEDAATLNNLGIALDNRGRAAPEEEKAGWFEQAIAAYNKSLELRPEDAATLYNLGIVLDNCGRAAPEEEKAEWFEQAIAAYNKSLELRPEDAATLYNLGNALDDRGQTAPEEEKAGWFEQAIAAYNKSLELRPEDAATLGNLASSLVRLWQVENDAGRKAEYLNQAESAIRKARQLDPDKSRYNYACVLALKGEQGACLAELALLVREHPELKEDIAGDIDFESVAHLEEFKQIIAPHSWQAHG
ncbi:MAG: tetratricopeptide repeat protein [Gammaproteobacteria bacterium]|nr:tetratricopeptide repeat protein [Gammaproteobacteria bacterium]